MTFSWPKFINENFFKNLSGFANQRVKILSTNKGTKNGDGYASNLLRIRVELDDASNDDRNKQLSLMVKLPASGGFTEMFSKTLKMFPKETETYEKIIPAFENLFASHGMNLSFAPKCLKTATNPDAIILEDLKEQGYEMLDKNSFDLEHCERVLETLAKFHAVSAVYREQNGNYSELFSKGLYNEDIDEIFTKHYDNTIGFLVTEILSKWPHSQDSVEKMKHWKDKLLKALIHSNRSDSGNLKFSVLCHGDFWKNNVLFKYGKNGNIVDVKFVDFQMAVFTSPSIDLSYFIFTSSAPDIKLQKYDYFVKFYHDHLVKWLNFFGYKSHIPTLKELQIDMLERGLYGMMSCIASLPMCIVDKSSECGPELYMGGDEKSKEFKRRLFGNPEYMSEMEHIFKFFNCRGLLDI